MEFIVKPQIAPISDGACNTEISCGSATCVGNCPTAAGCGINRV